MPIPYATQVSATRSAAGGVKLAFKFITTSGEWGWSYTVSDELARSFAAQLVVITEPTEQLTVEQARGD